MTTFRSTPKTSRPTPPKRLAPCQPAPRGPWLLAEAIAGLLLALTIAPFPAAAQTFTIAKVSGDNQTS